MSTEVELAPIDVDEEPVTSEIEEPITIEVEPVGNVRMWEAASMVTPLESEAWPLESEACSPEGMMHDINNMTFFQPCDVTKYTGLPGWDNSYLSQATLDFSVNDTVFSKHPTRELSILRIGTDTPIGTFLQDDLGYGKSPFPADYVMPESKSKDQLLKEAEEKIEELTRKIAELEGEGKRSFFRRVFDSTTQWLLGFITYTPDSDDDDDE